MGGAAYGSRASHESSDGGCGSLPEAEGAIAAKGRAGSGVGSWSARSCLAAAAARARRFLRAAAGSSTTGGAGAGAAAKGGGAKPSCRASWVQLCMRCMT